MSNSKPAKPSLINKRNSYYIYNVHTYLSLNYIANIKTVFSHKNSYEIFNIVDHQGIIYQEKNGTYILVTSRKMS